MPLSIINNGDSSATARTAINAIVDQLNNTPYLPLAGGTMTGDISLGTSPYKVFATGNALLGNVSAGSIQGAGLNALPIGNEYGVYFGGPALGIFQITNAFGANYVRADLSATSTKVQLAAQSAGTGAANVDIDLTPKGTGNINTTRGINLGGATGDAGLNTINGTSFVNLNVAGVQKFGVGGAQNFSYQPLIAQNGVVFRGITSQTPGGNGDLCIEATSNSLLTFKYKGSDGTIRSATLALV
jgi:hypothetical protein